MMKERKKKREGGGGEKKRAREGERKGEENFLNNWEWSTI